MWNKVIKFEKNEKGFNSYAIPTQKNGVIIGFFVATIDSNKKIKFEMHKKSAVILKKGEYSNANITPQKSNIILNYFMGKSMETTKTGTAGTNSFGEWWFCWRVWVEQTSLHAVNANNLSDPIPQNIEAPGNGY